MRRRITRAAVILAVAIWTSIAWAYSTGPPATRTGGFAVGGKPAEALCTICHTGAPVNDPNGLLEVLGAPAEYFPGAGYPITVRLSFNHSPDATPKWGFQFTAVSAVTGDSAGTLLYPPSLKVVKPTSPASVYKNRRYLEHGGDTDTDTASVHFGDLGPVEWSFEWVAPLDTARIYFFASGNAANGDGTHGTGDYIFTDVESTRVFTGQVGVDPNPPTATFSLFLARPSPNPMVQCTDLSWEIPRAGVVDLSVYDLMGRKIRTIFHDWHEAGPGANFWNGRRDDGNHAKNGVYFFRMTGPGGTVVHKITLAR